MVSKKSRQDVRVKNTIDADVSGSVYVDGGTISVE